MVSEWVAFLKKMLRTLTEVPMKAQIIDPNYNGTTSKINSEDNHLPLYSHQHFPAQCQDGWEISEVCLLTVLIQSLYLKYAQFCFPEQQLMCTVYQWTPEKVKLCRPSEMRALSLLSPSPIHIAEEEKLSVKVLFSLILSAAALRSLSSSV